MSISAKPRWSCPAEKMFTDHEFFREMAERKQIRPSARAIVLNAAGDQILVEKNLIAVEQNLNFIGGGLEFGESFETCLHREMGEETNAKIIGMSYLFVVENFIFFKGQITHGLEHYLQVQLDREQIESREPEHEYFWVPMMQLGEIDLRPHLVRDCIIDSTYRSIRHLISKSEIL